MHPQSKTPSFRPRWGLPAALAATLLAVPTIAFAAEADLVPISPEQQAAFGIALQPLVPAEEVLTRRWPARVAVPIRQSRVVSAPQPGIIASLMVAEGETVAAGDVLAELQSPELLEAQGELLDALTRLDLVASELARDRSLHQEGLVAERRLLETEARHRELTTAVEQGRQRLALAGMRPEDLTALERERRLTSTLAVRSPIAGVVLEQMASTGEAVTAAAPLYRVGQLSPLWLEVHVPVDRLRGIGVGDRVVLPDEGTEGRVITVGRMVHGEDQGVLVRAEVSEGVERLRPGQFVEVQIARSAGSAWRVPAAAVVRQGGRAWVFVSAEGGFRPVPVEVAAEEERSIVVTDDLPPDARLAVTGVAALKAAWLGGGE